MFHQDTNDKAQALMPRTKHKRDFNSLTVLKGEKAKILEEKWKFLFEELCQYDVYFFIFNTCLNKANVKTLNPKTK